VSENVPIRFPQGSNLSVAAPDGFKQSMDEILSFIRERTGVKFTRNEFIIKAVKFYLEYLLASKSRAELVEKIETAKKT